MNDITFRLVKAKDAERLLEIYSPYVIETAISFEFEPPSLDEFKKRISNTLERYPYIVAISDGNIVGYGYGSNFTSLRMGYIHSAEVSIYIDRQFRGGGIGTKLYTLLEEILAKQGIVNVNACIAHTQRENDPYLTNASEIFHSHMGYRLVGRFDKCCYKFNDWYDMVWMEKHIGKHTIPAPKFIPFKEIQNPWG